MTASPPLDLAVFMTEDGPCARWAGVTRRCAIGRGGIAVKRREGDGITPVGRWPMRRLLYRADRLARPATRLPCEAIRPDDGWCDDPSDPAYNRPVRLPYPARCERLARDDHLYDLVVVLGYNDDPVVPQAGSAVFLHLARADYGATQGCVALGLSDLLAVLEAAGPGSAVEVLAP